MKNTDKLSVFISLILRHKPEAISIKLDKHGYANVNELIDGINKNGKYYIDFRTLKHIVDTDSKMRYSFNKDFTKIRANQGHSINVDVDLKECEPPEILYHGTGEKYLNSILKEGLISKNRLYVHLSDSYNTAVDVGNRHGKAVILQINTKKMFNDGHKFYLSENKVWLTKEVPVKYIKVLK